MKTALNGNKQSKSLLSYQRRHKSKNDECYTPAYAVEALFVHVKKFKQRKRLNYLTV